jgi:hypothetical protein
MPIKRATYVKTCPICKEQFETHDSRVITDKEPCQATWKKQQARARYHRHLTGEEESIHWRNSESPTVKFVCGFLVKALPATRLQLDRGLAEFIRKHPEIKVTENIIPNCLTKLKFLRLVQYDRQTDTWLRLKRKAV